MATETERKFLVKGNGWKKKVTEKFPIRQGYLAKSRGVTVRIRIVNDEMAYITVKGKRVALSCPEYEYLIPVLDAEEMLAMSVTPLIEKTRHLVKEDGWAWEVDVFKGINKGLVMAELELKDDKMPICLPTWIGTEVSYDKRYTNAYLAEHVAPTSL